MPTWPETLPQQVLVDGYSEEPQDSVLRSSMDAGPNKTRLRFTAAGRDIPINMNLDEAQVDAFEVWFEEDIQRGAIPFDFPQPRKGTTVSVLIKGKPPYRLTPVGAGNEYWRLSMQLEVQP